jgi:hypothetical protein
LRDDLGEGQLGSLRMGLMAQVNKLERMFKLGRKNDEDRSAGLKADCGRLRESSKKLKSTMEELSNRMNNCETVMGIYSGKEKLTA